MATISGGEKFQAYLDDVSKRIEAGTKLRVGFLEGATYPDGTSVPMIAAIQNYGAPAAGIPPRPFFSNMIAKNSQHWGELFLSCMQIAGNDTKKALALMGEVLADQLKQAIEDINSPPLSPVTLMIRKMRSQNPDLKVTGKTVGEAAARVKAGEDYSGVIGTVLQDPYHYTNVMHDAVAYEVSSES